jgi:cytochrome c biogenesis protein CcdA
VQLVLYALGAGATLWVAALISKAASRALEEAEAEGAGGDAARPLSEDDAR